jgi:hypothetical protein
MNMGTKHQPWDDVKVLSAFTAEVIEGEHVQKKECPGTDSHLESLLQF